MFRYLALACLLLHIIGCDRSNGPERCFHQDDCSGGAVCVRLGSGAQTCAKPCDVATDLVCASGRTCAAIPAEDATVDVCLPPGDVEVGLACAVSVDCVAGAICVARVGQVDPTCERLCDAASGTGCTPAQACVVLDVAQPTRGTCVTP